MPRTIITVCKNQILSNQKNGTREPAVRVFSSGKVVARCHVANVVVDGKVVGRFIYDHDNKKPWGARAWFETVGDTAVEIEK